MNDFHPQEGNILNCLQENEDEFGNRQSTKYIYNLTSVVKL